MLHLLLAVIYLSFISLGLPDALLGASPGTWARGRSPPSAWASPPWR